MSATLEHWNYPVVSPDLSGEYSPEHSPMYKNPGVVWGWENAG